MNLPNGFERSSPILFWIILGISLGAGLMLVALVSRRGCAGRR